MTCKACSRSIPEGTKACPACGASTSKQSAISRLIGFVMAAWRSFKAERAQYFPAGGPSTPLRHWTKRSWLALGSGLVLSMVPFLGYLMWILGLPLVLYTAVLGRRVLKQGAKLNGGLIIVASIVLFPTIFLPWPVEATGGFISVLNRVRPGWMRDAAANVGAMAPLQLDYQWYWVLVGVTEHIKLTNCSGKPVTVLKGLVIRSDGSKCNLSLHGTIKPYETLDTRLQDGDGFFAPNFMFMKGDQILVYCEGFPIPGRLFFE